MQHNIVVRKALRLPHLLEWVYVKQIDVNRQVDIFPFFGIVPFDVAGQPAFQSAAFIVIGTAAPCAEIITCLKTVYKKIPDIFTTFGK